MTAALGALLVPATAGAATKKTPVIKKVAPKSASVGDTLTIYGKNFRKGKGKNRVLFKGAGGKTLFVKAGLSTSKKLTLAVPKTLEKYMTVKNGQPVATRFRLRVLGLKLSKAYTASSRSPLIGPEKAATGVSLDPNADTDGDGLINGFESGVLKTDPSKADTDGDGVTDGFEYGSAVDLNNDDYRNPTKVLPYPGKRPYPNPLDGTDANYDFDGDWIPDWREHQAWMQHTGLEWLFRLMQEPHRLWRRYILDDIPVLLWLVRQTRARSGPPSSGLSSTSGAAAGSAG